MVLYNWRKGFCKDVGGDTDDTFEDDDGGVGGITDGDINMVDGDEGANDDGDDTDAHDDDIVIQLIVWMDQWLI